MKFLAFLFLLFFTFCDNPIKESTTIPNFINLEGYVFDGVDKPLKDIEVNFPKYELKITTDINGFYSFKKDSSFLHEFNASHPTLGKKLDNDKLLFNRAGDTTIVAHLSLESIIDTNLPPVYIVERSVLTPYIGMYPDSAKTYVEIKASDSTKILTTKQRFELGVLRDVNKLSGTLEFYKYNSTLSFSVYAYIVFDGVIIAKSKPMLIDTKVGPIEFPPFIIGNTLPIINDIGIQPIIPPQKEQFFHPNIRSTFQDTSLTYNWKYSNEGSEFVSGDIGINTYETVGYNRVSLQITDAGNNVLQVSQPILVTDVPYRENNFTNDTVSVGDIVNFQIHADKKSNVRKIFWTIAGNGTIVKDSTFGAVGRLPFTFPTTISGENELFEISVDIIDLFGTTSSKKIEIMVLSDKPDFTINLSKDTVTIADTISFELKNIVDKFGTIATYEWKYNNDAWQQFDGTKQNFVVSNNEGIGTLSIRITDDDGVYTEKSCVIVVVNDLPSLTINDYSSKVKVNTIQSLNYSVRDKGVTTVSYSYDSINYQPASPTFFSFTTPDTLTEKFTLFLRVSDEDGCIVNKKIVYNVLTDNCNTTLFKVVGNTASIGNVISIAAPKEQSGISSKNICLIATKNSMFISQKDNNNTFTTFKNYIVPNAIEQNLDSIAAISDYYIDKKGPHLLLITQNGAIYKKNYGNDNAGWSNIGSFTDGKVREMEIISDTVFVSLTTGNIFKTHIDTLNFRSILNDSITATASPKFYCLGTQNKNELCAFEKNDKMRVLKLYSFKRMSYEEFFYYYVGEGETIEQVNPISMTLYHYEKLNTYKELFLLKSGLILESDKF